MASKGRDPSLDMAMEMMMRKRRQIGSSNSDSGGSGLIDAKLEEEHRISASRQCPSCGCKLDYCKPVSHGIIIRLFSLNDI